MERVRWTVLLLVAAAAPLAAQPAEIQEERQVIKTYPFGGPNPSPTRPGGQRVQQRIYPYFQFDEYASAGVDRTWNVVRLENRYIQAFILPGVGGKLLGAIEKSTGKEFVYYNHVLKFRNIAMRGPWTSGGIEANFGIMGHAPSTATPVDYLVRRNPDGSVSCIVGAMDLPSRTQWRVEYRLAPEKAYVEARSLWYNAQPFEQSYYVWMNVAEKAGSDLELVLPGTAWIGHNYAVPSQPWPISAGGQNLALYRNHTNGRDGSYFVTGKENDFSGGYWHDADFGYGHWAPHEDVPGQKFFHWALSREGAIWENLLTDRDGQYFEHQTGRLLDQSDTGSFAPYATDRWAEIFFPYKETGPMVKATPYGALNVRNSGDGIVLSFCALQSVDETVVVRAGNREIASDRIRLQPMEVYEKRVPAAVPSGELRIEIGDKLTYTDDPKDGVLSRPLTFRNYAPDTPEGLYQSAARDERERRYGSALHKYLSCLERDPSNIRALTRIAAIYGRQGEYRKALEYARKALGFAMYDPDANFVYGVLARKTGHLVDAKEALGWAARSMAYRASALSELGCIALLEGNPGRAAELLGRSLDYDVHNVRTLQVLATADRLLRKPAQARETLARILDIDPLNHLARFEEYLLDPRRQALADFQSLIRNELPHETYLEIAAYYVDLGRNGDALRVLQEAPEQATVRYWQAWLLRERDPLESRRILEKASAISPYLVFPFREESIPVFQWAAAARPDDWKPSYYLGLIYWGMQRTDDARKLFEACGDRPGYAPAYVTRAFLEEADDPVRAQKDFERAYALDRKDWRNAYHLANFYMQHGSEEQALGVAIAAATEFPSQDAIKVLAAHAYRASGRYQDCNAVLADATILPFEGQSDVHELFVQCLVSQAMVDMKAGRHERALEELERSREYPERLGTGAPADPDYRLQDFLEMFCYRESAAPAKEAEAAARIRAYSMRRHLPDFDTQRKAVEKWYRTSFRAEPERTAAEELRRLLRPAR
ncbi:MAG TPA: DUF5107 domain-containing protein [Bryobacteraceae bacterium]|jgi:tetratricopeptide (TPR) repeat protein|nr:DUF5107 domain-containing protein [Bryobacteraceae bacterium]